MNAPPRSREEPGLIRAALFLLRKDLLIEWRTKARLNSLIFFALATLLLFSFALGPDTVLLRKNAGGYLWLGILFASVLALGESFRVESENNSLDGLRLAPVDARALFLGKALGNTLLLFFLAWMLVPVIVALYDARLGTDVVLGLPGGAPRSWTEAGAIGVRLLDLGAVIALGCLAISAPGTIYSAIANNARARDVLLPLLLFPLIVPSLMGATKATTLVIGGDPMGQLNSWLALLLGFNLIYWSLGFALFPRVVED
jgi:heme exporter protein B